MLSKCANPACSRNFLYLHEGKLFRLDRAIDGSDDRSFGSEPEMQTHRRLEFFWLCDDCAPRMTVIKKGSGVVVEAFSLSQGAGAA